MYVYVSDSDFYKIYWAYSSISYLSFDINNMKIYDTMEKVSPQSPPCVMFKY